MRGNISNFQYVGYLSDFLATYNDIDVFTAQYNCAKENFDTAKQKLQEYNDTFSMKNCLLGWALIFGVLLLTFPVLFLPHTNVFVWLTLCAIIASVIIVVSKVVYTKKVLPIHRSILNDELNRAKESYGFAYEALIARRSNLNDLKGEIDEKCSQPLSIYLMREAAKEGECSNIPQGIRYYKSRYKTLESATDESSVNLKKRIDEAQSRAEARKVFLDGLDESAQTLFQ
jgi:hypothetical protein